KAAGRKYCAHAGYGFKWSRGRRVTDPQESAAIATIVELRRQGLSWYAIAARLLHQGIRTPAGKDWAPSRVPRAYLSHVPRPRSGRPTGYGAPHDSRTVAHGTAGRGRKRGANRAETTGEGGGGDEGAGQGRADRPRAAGMGGRCRGRGTGRVYPSGGAPAARR